MLTAFSQCTGDVLCSHTIYAAFKKSVFCIYVCWKSNIASRETIFFILNNKTFYQQKGDIKICCTNSIDTKICYLIYSNLCIRGKLYEHNLLHSHSYRSQLQLSPVMRV